MTRTRLLVLPTSLVAAILVAIFGPRVDGVATSSLATYVSIGLAGLTTAVHGPRLTKAALRRLYGKAVRYAIKHRAAALAAQKRALHPPPEPTVMYDSVDVAQIPRHAAAVAGYVDGAWPTYQQLVRAFPHAKRLSIAVNAHADAVCLDIEAGDATPSEAAAWVLRQHGRGIDRPVLYCSAAITETVLAQLAAAHIHRDQVRIWSAHYANTPHICAPHTCGYPAADATQWTDRADHRNLDQSLCNPGFL